MAAKKIDFSTATQDKKKEEKKQQGPNLWLILLLVVIVVSFIGGSFFYQQPSISSDEFVFGSYNGVPISFRPGDPDSALVNYVNSNLERFQSQLGQEINPADAMGYFYYQQAFRQGFEQAVIREALMQELEKSGVEVSYFRVDALVKDHPLFRDNTDGSFSTIKYNNTSKERILEIRQEYLEIIKNQLAGESKVYLSAVSDVAVDTLESMAWPKRSIEFVVLSEDNFPEESLLAFANDNADEFRAINLSRITIKTSSSDAQAVRDEVLEGERAFGEIAVEKSEDGLAASEGAMGKRYIYEVSRDFTSDEDLESLLALEAGEISPVFETNFGWVFYKIDEAMSDADFSDEETLEKVKSYLRTNERAYLQDSLLEIAEELKVQAESSGWDAVDFPSAAISSDFFPLNYGNFTGLPTLREATDNPTIGSLSNDESFFEGVFKSDIGSILDPIIGGNEVVLIRVADEQLSAPEGEEFTYQDFTLVNLRDQALRNSILDSDLLEDNFELTFQRLYPRQPGS